MQKIMAQTKDWFTVGQAWAESHYKTLTVHATLRLNKGDQVQLMLREGVIHDGVSIPHGPYSLYIGWL